MSAEPLMERVQDAARLVQLTCTNAEMLARGTEAPSARELRIGEVARFARQAWDEIRDLMPAVEAALGGGE